MLINDWDIANAGARQWNVEFASCKINSNSNWIDGSAIPTLFRNNTSFKTLTIRLMLNGRSREDLLLQRSDILAQLLEPAVITLDGYSHKFLGIMASISSPNEESMQRFHTLTFTFDCCEYGDCKRYTIDGLSEMDIYNPGNIITPIIIELTATQDLDYFEIRGICRKLSVMGRGIEEERNTQENNFILDNNEKKTLGTINGEYIDNEYDLVTSDDENIDVTAENQETYRLKVEEHIYQGDYTPILSSSTEWKNNLTVTFDGLKAGQTIILNGETGVFVDQDTELPPENIAIWELPTFMPGSNLVYLSDQSVKVSIRFYPRYM